MILTVKQTKNEYCIDESSSESNSQSKAASESTTIPTTTVTVSVPKTAPTHSNNDDKLHKEHSNKLNKYPSSSHTLLDTPIIPIVSDFSAFFFVVPLHAEWHCDCDCSLYATTNCPPLKFEIIHFPLITCIHYTPQYAFFSAARLHISFHLDFQFIYDTKTIRRR